MHIVLQGSSPCATTAAILLMSRARQLGNQRLQVDIVGDPDDLVTIPGPALAHAPVLASCGVGRDLGQGATVVLPGAPGATLAISASIHGRPPWFEVARSGAGTHPATQALSRLSTDPRVPARKLAKQLRGALHALGMTPDPGLLDLLFGAPVPPLTRLSLALRAGRAMSGLRGEPVTRFLSPRAHAISDPLPLDFDPKAVWALFDATTLQALLDGLSTGIRDGVESWLSQARTLALEDDGRDLILLHHLVEIATHLVQLPAHSILPPLGAAEDAVAMAFETALGAEGEADANQQLGRIFRFLGGRYVARSAHVFELPAPLPPEGRLARWRWFCQQALEGKHQAEALWPRIIDPPQ